MELCSSVLLVHFNWSALEFLLVKIYLYLLLFFDIFTQKIIKNWYGKSRGRIGLALVLSNDDSKTLRPKQKSLTIHSDKGLTFVTTKDLNVSPTQIYTQIKLCKTGAQQLCTAMCTESTA